MGRLSKNQLVDKLAVLFKNAEDVDGLVEEAKILLVNETRQAKRKELGEFFDSQIQTEKDRGTPEAIVEMLQKQKTDVLNKTREMTFAKENIPFIPVITKTYLTIFSRMPMVRNGDNAGYSRLDPAKITDIQCVPKKPYYIFDVEDGTAILGKTLADAEGFIRRNERFPLTADEIMSLGIHSNVVLSDHYVLAIGSRFSRLSQVPILWLDGDRPELGYGNGDSDSDYRWGSASCGGRS